MEDLTVAYDRTVGLQAPKTDLPSLASWRDEHSPQAPTTLDPFLVSHMSCGQKRDPGYQGKKTAGIDGVKNLKPHERLALAQRLHLDLPAQPVRRVWIPKPGKAEKRGLGIPVMQDRALQALLKLALEPE